MIKPKPKQCSICGEIRLLWRSNPKMCKECANKEKAPQKSPKEARKPIAKQSAKRKKLDAAYNVLAKSFKQRHPHCMARLEGCSGVTSDIHHMRGRNVYLLDESEFLAVCRNCHNWIELHPAEAKELGFSKNRLDI